MICVEKQYSNDGSIKYLWQLTDGKTVESIYFIFCDQIYTCISSQVGCNVKCEFCETGKQSNLRNLLAEEMYGQVAETLNDLRSKTLTRLYQVAVAGMGEPLLNFQNLMNAASRMIDEDLAETISISTSGVVPKIRELVGTPITKLFISLHATTDAIRNILVPMNRKYPISELLKASRYFCEKVGVPVTATYLMFDGVNDSDDDLERLTQLLDPQLFIIQLSEWNWIYDAKFKRSPRIEFFYNELSNRGYDVFILHSKGSDIEGGCGQLRSRHLTKQEKNLAVELPKQVEVITTRLDH